MVGNIAMTMPKIHPPEVRKRDTSAEHQEPLLSSSNSGDEAPGIGKLPSQRRLPSINRPQAQPGLPRAPRTPNRVRFNLEDLRRSSENEGRERSDGIDGDDGDVEEEEEENHFNSTRSLNTSARYTGQRAPLLTGIEAPSVTVANLHSGADAVNELLENNARPKSGMMSAFMNMANSIM